MASESKRTAIQVGVIVLILAVSAFLLFRSDESKPAPLTDVWELVDCQTGERFTMNRSEFRTIPVKNPNTGERTLYPVVHLEETQRLLAAGGGDRFFLAELKDGVWAVRGGAEAVSAATPEELATALSQSTGGAVAVLPEEDQCIVHPRYRGNLEERRDENRIIDTVTGAIRNQ